MSTATFAPKIQHVANDAQLFDRETALEKAMIKRSRDRYFKAVARCREQEHESSTSHGKLIMKRGITYRDDGISVSILLKA